MSRYTLLCTKQVINKDLLYSSGSSTRVCVCVSVCVCVCVHLCIYMYNNHFAVHLKLMQHLKLTIV